MRSQENPAVFLEKGLVTASRAASSRRPHGVLKCRTPRCAQYERKHHRSNAVASPLDAVGSHRTPSDGAHFELEPLSHQGGILTVIPRRPKKCRTPRCAQYERKHHRSNAVASPLDAVGSHRTPSDGAQFEHTQNKHRRSAFK